jgi:hypothetical protein
VKRYLLILVLIVQFTALRSQSPPWFFINTSVELTHIVLVLPDVAITLDGAQMQPGDYIGAFFSFSDTLLCGTGTGQTGDVGGMMLTGSVNAATLWGAEPNVYNGFQPGELMKWKVWRASDGSVFDAIAMYDTNTPGIPDSGIFQYNGISKLASITSFSLPGVDMSVNQQLSPQTSCQLSETESVTVLIENHDTLDASGFAIYISINQGDTISEFYPGVVPANSTTTFTFSQVFDLSEDGTYKFNVWLEMPGDVNLSNDYNKKTIINQVHPRPEIVRDTMVCEGDSVILYSAEMFPGFAWSNGDFYYYTTVTEPGWYTLTVTNEAGCEGVDSVLFANYPQPEIILDDTLIYCEGGYTNTRVNQRFRLFHWSNGLQTPNFYMTSPGTYFLTVTDYAGCVWVDSIIGIQIPVPEPFLGPNIVTAVLDTVVLDAGAGYDSYFWSSGETTQSIMPAAYGIYSVTVGIGDCYGSNDVIVIPEPDEPNPSDLVYQIHGNLTEGEFVFMYYRKDNPKLEIYNELGQYIGLVKLQLYKNQISLEGLKSGLYFLTFTSEGEKYIDRIVKL